MKRFLILTLATIFTLGIVGVATAGGDNPLRAQEKKVHKGFADLIPPDKIIGVDKFYKVYNDVMAGKKKAYLIDTRTHPEFYAFHIEGTDHVHSGHVYTIPKKIKDPNTEIYIWCRKSHRAKYVAGFLYKYGYKNVWLYKDGVVGAVDTAVEHVLSIGAAVCDGKFTPKPSDAGCPAFCPAVAFCEQYKPRLW